MPTLPEISKITIPSGTYAFKDEVARNMAAGGIQLKGETTTPLTDMATTNPIKIKGADYTAVSQDAVFYGNKEFVFDGTNWHEFGDLTGLGDLALKDTASGSYTPAGTVSQPTFTGTASTVNITAADNTSGNYQPKGSVSQPTFTGSNLTSTGAYTPTGNVTVVTATTENKTTTVSKADSGEATYTPQGSVSAPTISVATAGTTATVNSMTSAGSLPSLTTSVADETLTISFSAGALPTSTNTTVKTGDASYSASQPTFTGTGARLVTGAIAVPKTYSGSFIGTEGSVSVSGTPAGTVSQPTFTGTKVQISGSTTASGTVSQPTFTGTAATITVS